MDTSIITSIIAVVGSLIGILLNNYFTSKKVVSEALTKRELAEKEEQKKRDEGFAKSIEQQNSQIMMLSNKVDNLSEKVEKHNSVVERTYKLENMAVQMSGIQEKLEQRMEDWHKDTLRRLDALEGK